MSFRARRIDSSLTAVEFVDVAVSVTGCVVSIAGEHLESFTADDIEAMILFTAEYQDGNPLVFVVGKGCDVVLLVDGDVTQILEMVREMKLRRGGKTTKFVVYWLPNFDEFLLTSFTAGTLRWQPDQVRNPLPFPHSRLDFLKFNTNRSVMAKLSAFRDRSIEFSADSVSVSGTAFLSSLDSGSGSVDDLELLCDRVSQALEGGNQAALQEVATQNSPMLHDMVAILSDAALYLTERTGGLRCRHDFQEFRQCVVVNKKSSGNVPPAIFFKLSNNDVLWLHSKFAMDLHNRLMDLPNCSHLRTTLQLPASPLSEFPAAQTALDLVSTVVAPSKASIVETAIQTDFIAAAEGVTATLLRIRNQELEEELRSKQMALDTLRRRPDPSRKPAAKVDAKHRDAEESALRFYAAVLESELERVRDLEIEGRLRALEDVFEGREDDPHALKYALAEANRREAIANKKVSEIRSQMVQLQGALTSISDALRQTLDAQVESLHSESAQLREQLLSRSSTHKWSDLVAHISDVEKRVQQEVGVRTASLTATIASLNDELKKREHQVSMLAEELDRFFSDAGDASAGAACLAALKKITDRCHAVAEYHAAVANRAGIETKIRALIRQADDMNAAREAFLFETENMLALPTMLASASEIEKLRRENAMLRSLQHLPALAAELAELRVVAEETAKHKAEALESKAILRASVEKVRATDSTTQSLKRDLASAKTIIAGLEKEAAKQAKRADETAAEALRTSERQRREIAELRKQLKVKLDSQVQMRRSSSRSQPRAVVSPARTPDVREPHPEELQEAPRVPPIELESPVPKALLALQMERDRMQRKLSEQRDRSSLDRTDHIEVVELPTARSFGVVSDEDPIALTKQRFEEMKSRLTSLHNQASRR